MSLFRPFLLPSSYTGGGIFSDPFSFSIFDDTDYDAGNEQQNGGTAGALTAGGAQAKGQSQDKQNVRAGTVATRHPGDLFSSNALFSAGPRVDIVEEQQRFVLTAELPGVKREDGE